MDLPRRKDAVGLGNASHVLSTPLQCYPNAPLEFHALKVCAARSCCVEEMHPPQCLLMHACAAREVLVCHIRHWRASLGIRVCQHCGTCVFVDIEAWNPQAPSARAVESSRGLYQAPAPEAEPAQTAAGAGAGAAEESVDASLTGQSLTFADRPLWQL